MPCTDAGSPVAHLEELRHEMTGRGWITSLQEPSGRTPRLFVQNPDPEAAVLKDHILVVRYDDGLCWFVWSWATRVAPASDIGHAADRITHVLRTIEDHHARSM
jgi:hypothetical protein